MHMIAGLGNPGREYEGSKHNAGFTVIDELARRWGVNTWQTRMDAEVAIANVDGEQVLLVKPQTYMNDSGKSVGPLMRWYKIDEKDVYVVYDDMDLPIGKLRIRENGSDGGHRTPFGTYGRYTSCVDAFSGRISSDFCRRCRLCGRGCRRLLKAWRV